MPITKTTITLEEKEYYITTPLTLGDLADLRVAIMDVPNPDEDPKIAAKRVARHPYEVISAGLISDYPDMTPEKIFTMRATIPEAEFAFDEICALAGVMSGRRARQLAEKKGDPPSGEAQAEPSSQA